MPLQEDNVTSAADKDVRRLDVILFETPELDTFLVLSIVRYISEKFIQYHSRYLKIYNLYISLQDNAHFSEKEIETFSGISEIDNNKVNSNLLNNFCWKSYIIFTIGLSVFLQFP